MFVKKTETYDVDPNNPDPKALTRAAEIISGGGILVYPTDTLYGFGVDARNQVALNRLYDLKGRDESKPVSIIVKNINQAENLIGPVTDFERWMFEKLMPGKTTLILKKRKTMDSQRLNAFRKIGFRIPHSKICKQLTELTNTPITSTSVNISTKDNLTSISEIKALFNDRVDVILNIGPLKTSKGSTVIDLSVGQPVILRQGDISATDLEQKLGFPLLHSYPKKFVITFVCSGNICRSPMAEGLLKRKIAKSKYKSFIEINSAGTLNIADAHPTIEAMDVAHNDGINITEHLSRGLNKTIIHQSNLVLCMALDHIHYIQENFPEYRSRAKLLKQINIDSKLSNPSIPDPIGQSLSYYEKIFNQISNEIDRITPHIYSLVDEFLLDSGKKST